MIEAAEQALDSVQNRQRADLEADPMLRLALTRRVEIVGDAAARVSEAGRVGIAAIPWAQVVGMRNRLVRAYFDINLDILWDTVQIALPALIPQLKTSVEKE